MGLHFPDENFKRYALKNQHHLAYVLFSNPNSVIFAMQERYLDYSNSGDLKKYHDLILFALQIRCDKKAKCESCTSIGVSCTRHRVKERRPRRKTQTA